MKWVPSKIPRIKMRRESLRTTLQLKVLLKITTAIAMIREAITSRQRAIEKTLTPANKRMNMAAVPKSAPAVAPSTSETLLLLFGAL
jgi:hypothetical protein